MIDIRKFCRKNKNLSMKIFSHSDGLFTPIFQSKHTKPGKRSPINLVLNRTVHWDSGELGEHFYPVTNLMKFTQKLYKSNPCTRTTYSSTTACNGCGEVFSLLKGSKTRMNDGEIHLGLHDSSKTEKFLEHQFLCNQGSYAL